jgi:two-component system, sensor histidine kinase and response regulator
MAPHTTIVLVWLLFHLPNLGLGGIHEVPDSISILRQDSLAYKTYLAKPDSSIAVAKACLEKAITIKSSYLQGFSCYILAKSYWAKGNYKLSAEYGFKSLRFFENTSELKLWSKSLLALARTFVDLGNYAQGEIYLNRAMILSKQHHDEYILGEVFREKSMLFSEQKKYDSALYYSDEGLKIFAACKDSVSESILFSRKAKIYFILGNYKSSNFYNRKALLYDSLVGNRRALGIAYFQSARDAVQFNKFDSAILLLRKSIPINKEMHNLTTLIKVHKLLANIYEQQRKSDLAIRELNIASEYKDSLYNLEKTGQIAEMQSLHELAAKQQTIELLARDNKFNKEQVSMQRLYVGFLFTCVVLAGVAIFFLQRYRKLQQLSHRELAVKNRSIEQQKEEIQSQAETLQQLNHLKSKLFSVISHDLRGPMATLHAILDLLLHKHMTTDEFIGIAEKLKFSMDVTERTLENLLNWSLSQMEGIKAEPKIIDIRTTITEACNLMVESAERKNVALKHHIDDSVMVNADEDQVLLILRNLIHNAIKFSKPYNNIFVSATQDEEFCHVLVKDTGIGMTKAEIETVVSSKQHFSKTGTMQEKGTGLGLLLCQEFIKLNGGEIKIRSSINNGTEVSFSLPLAVMSLN